MSEQEMMAWIDAQDYQTLLEKWRFAPVGDAFFTGAVGDHYSKVMIEKRSQVGPQGAINASKQVGWSK